MRHTHRVWPGTSLTTWADDDEHDHIHRMGRRADDPWTSEPLPVAHDHVHIDIPGHVTSRPLISVGGILKSA